MIKSDFHIHTKEDPLDRKEIRYNSKEMIKFCAKLGYKILSITNHTSIFFNKDIKEFAHKKGILLIPGTEAVVEGKEVLIINAPLDLYKRFSKKKPRFEYLDRLREENALIIAPHAFYPRKNCLQKSLIDNINKFDAIEYSHFYTKYLNFNKKAVKAAKRFNKPLVGTSDAHRYIQFNKTYSLLDCEPKKDDVLEAIRKNRIKVKSKPLDLFTFSKIGLQSIGLLPKRL